MSRYQHVDTSAVLAPEELDRLISAVHSLYSYGIDRHLLRLLLQKVLDARWRLRFQASPESPW
jgi:hypothetical protein